MKISHALLGATAVIAAAVALTPVSAQAAACNANLIPEPNSLIRKYWESKGGGNSAYGCPTTKETGYANRRGSYQRFKHGMIIWEPRQGPAALIKAFYKNGGVNLKWDDYGRDWDFFNVRYTINPKQGGLQQQKKVARDTPWNGSTKIPAAVDPDYYNEMYLQVQGCDRGGLLSGGASDCGEWSTWLQVKY